MEKFMVRFSEFSQDPVVPSFGTECRKLEAQEFTANAYFIIQSVLNFISRCIYVSDNCS